MTAPINLQEIKSSEETTGASMLQFKDAMRPSDRLISSAGCFEMFKSDSDSCGFLKCKDFPYFSLFDSLGSAPQPTTQKLGN